MAFIDTSKTLMEELTKDKKKKLMTPRPGQDIQIGKINKPPALKEDSSYGMVKKERTGQVYSTNNQSGYSQGKIGLAPGGGSFSTVDIKESTQRPQQQVPKPSTALMQNLPKGIMQPQIKARTELIGLEEGKELGMGWQARRSANRQILGTQGSLAQQSMAEQGRIGSSIARSIGQQNVEAARANLPGERAKTGLAQAELAQAPLMAEMDRLSVAQVQEQISGGKGTSESISENLQDILSAEHGEVPVGKRKKKEEDLMKPSH